MKTLASVQAGLVALYGSIFLLALNGLFAKAIPLDAISITQSRSVIASVALLLILLLQYKSLVLRSFKQGVGVYSLGALLGLHWITYFHSMQISSVALGMLALFSYPVITVLIEPLFERRLPGVADMFAAALVFFGIFLMVSPDLFNGSLASDAVQGAFWGGISALLFALRNTAQKYLFPTVNSMTLMAHQTMAIGLILIPFAHFDSIVGLSLKDWLLLVLLACLSTATAHTLLSMSLKRLPAKSVAMIGCLTPLVGGFLAWLVLGETPSVMIYLGGFIILSVAVYESVKQHARV